MDAKLVNPVNPVNPMEEMADLFIRTYFDVIGEWNVGMRCFVFMWSTREKYEEDYEKFIKFEPTNIVTLITEEIGDDSKMTTPGKIRIRFGIEHQLNQDGYQKFFEHYITRI